MRFARISLADAALAGRCTVDTPLFPPCTLTVPPISFGDRRPDGLPVDDPAGLAQWGTAAVEIAETHVHRLTDAVVHGPHGLVTLGEFALEETLAHVPFHRPGYRKDGAAIEIPEPVMTAVLPEATHGLAPLSHNYYHWMLDSVPRLQVEPLGPRAAHGTLLLSPVESAPQRDVCDLLLRGPAPLGLVGEGQAVRVQSLRLVPNLVRHGFAPNPHIATIFDRLRELLAPGSSDAKPARRLYVSRRDSARRPLVNEDAVAALAARHGFETVVLQGMPLAEQIRLFSGATHILAPHGAGLANLVFCPPGAAVLELQLGTYLNWCFRRLCGVRGLRYGCLIGAELEGGAGWIHTRRWSAPLDRLQAALEDPAFAAMP